MGVPLIRKHHGDGVAILTFVCIGNDLSGFDTVTDMNIEVMDVAIEGLQAVVVSDDNERTREWAGSGDSHASGKDRLDVLILLRDDLQQILSVDARLRSFQRIGIFAGLDAVEMNSSARASL
jgi:hypothetical protein